VGPGSAGTTQGNDVIDNVWAPAAIDNPAAAASGILIFAARSVNVTSNIVGNNQFGIAAESSDAGVADGALIRGNAVFGTRIFDDIELCSNTNTVSNNTISGSGEAGIHLDSRCGGSGNGNRVSRNVINEACAGILVSTGTSGNSTSPDTFANVGTTVLTSDQCVISSQATSAEERQQEL